MSLTSSMGDLYAPLVVIVTPKRQRVQKRKRQPRPAKRAGPARRTRSAGPFRTIGKWLGGAVDRFVGTGDYSIERNSVLRPGTVPAMHSSSTTTVVRHREYIGDVLSNNSTTPVVRHFPLNPGLAQTFPWLSNLAQSFEMYRLLGCVFEYRTLAGDVTTQSNQGYVVAAVNYNPTGAPFLTKLAIENAMGGQSKKPSEDMFIPVECKPMLNPLGEYFVRDAAISASQNLNFYDVGIVTIATGGNPTNGVILGELWVTYEVELAKPAIDELAISEGYGAHLTTNGVSSTTPFGAETKTLGSYNNLSVYFPTTSAYDMVIPVHPHRYYYIHLLWYGTVATNVTLPTRTLTNATITTLWANGLNWPNAPSSAGTLSLGMSLSMIIRVTDTGLPVTLTLGNGGNAGVFPAGTSVLDAIIVPQPDEFRPPALTDAKTLTDTPPPSLAGGAADLRDIEECDEDLYSAIRLRVAEVAERKKLRDFPPSRPGL